MSQQDSVRGFAAVAVREDGAWRCELMNSAVLTGLDTAITALRSVPSTGAVLGMLAVDDEFFLLLRPLSKSPPQPTAGHLARLVAHGFFFAAKLIVEKEKIERRTTTRIRFMRLTPSGVRG